MKTLFLLITLTQNGAGDINASFVNTDTLEQCQQKALMVEGVFKASDIPVIESRCIKSHLRFSDFGHASSSSMIRHFYQVGFNKETVTIDAAENWHECMRGLESADSSRRYCASSVQFIMR